MNHNTIVFALPVLIIGAWQTAAAQDAVVPDDFGSIQAAVLGATDGDGNGTVEIFVRAGTYAENVLIQNRSNLSITGEDALTTTVQGSAGLDTFDIDDTSGFTLQRLTITNPGPRDGVDLSDVSNSSIRANVFSGGGSGLSMNRVQSIRVENNDVSGTSLEAIRIQNAAVAILRGNVMHDNAGEGLAVDLSQRVIAIGNEAVDNGSNGFRDRQSSNDVFIQNLSMRNVDDGFRFEDLTNSRVRGNTSINNLSNGLRMRDTSGNLIARNRFNNNTENGMRLENSADDFGQAAGTQAPVGENQANGNLEGPLRID